jgi:hypothetical protein
VSPTDVGRQVLPAYSAYVTLSERSRELMLWDAAKLSLIASVRIPFTSDAAK